MLPNEIKTYAYLKLRFITLIVIILIIALIFSITISLKTYVQQSSYSNNNIDLKTKVDEIGYQLVKSAQDVKIWNESLSAVYSERAGLDLDLAKKKIEDLRIANNIASVSVSLTSPALRIDLQGLQFTNISYSMVNISLDAYTDRDILRFIEGLKEALPGAINLINVKVMVVSNVSKNIIFKKRIDNDPKNINEAYALKPVVSGKIEVLWQNLEDKKVKL